MKRDERTLFSVEDDLYYQGELLNIANTQGWKVLTSAPSLRLAKKTLQRFLEMGHLPSVITLDRMLSDDDRGGPKFLDVILENNLPSIARPLLVGMSSQLFPQRELGSVDIDVTKEWMTLVLPIILTLCNEGGQVNREELARLQQVVKILTKSREYLEFSEDLVEGMELLMSTQSSVGEMMTYLEINGSKRYDTF